MNLTIYTYGHIDAMLYVTNGIAMILGSSFADMMIKTTSFIGASYHALRASYASSRGGAKHHLIRIIGMVVVINALILPKTDMLIIDNVTKQKETVSNLPYGFAIPIGFMENFGHILVANFEQVFQTIGSANYRDYGMVFGARLVRESRNWRIANPEFTSNMSSFIRNCVIRDIAMGYKYGMDDIFLTNNVWELVSKKASPLKRSEIRVKGSTRLMKCKDIADQIISPAFESEIDKINVKYFGKEFALADALSRIRQIGQNKKEQLDPGKILKKNIKTIFGEYFNSKTSAQDTIRQYMVMNSMSDFARTYGFARSSIIQENNWRIAGDLANIYLPLLLSVFKGLIYASFVFMIPIIIFGGGMGKYLSYLMIVGSLQLWPALNSILNMFIDLYSASNLKDMADGAINYTNFSKVGDYSDKIVVVASGLQMVVPYLAFSIMQGGVSGFIHLASNISSGASNAANIAGAEVASGNKSLDNISVGNQQFAINQGFKTDMNTSYRMGSDEFQHMDGAIERIFPSGSSSIQTGAGVNISSGSKRLNIRKMLTDNISQDFAKTRHALEGQQVMYRDANYDTINKVSSLLGQIAERETLGENFDYSMLGEKGESLQKFSNQTKSIAKQKRISYEDAASILLKAYAGGGMNLPFLNIGLGADLNYSKSRISATSESEDESKSQEESRRREYTNTIRGMLNEQFSTSNNIELSYSDDIRRSVENQKTIEDHVSIQTEKLKRYSAAYSKAESMESFGESEMFHELENRVAEEYGISNLEAHRMIENDDSKSQAVWSEMVADFVNKNGSMDMESCRQEFSDENLSSKIQEFKDQYQHMIQDNDSNLIEQLIQRNDMGQDVKKRIMEVVKISNSNIKDK